MCLIIASPNGNKPDPEIVLNAIADNPDGWGIVSVQDGKLVAWRGFALEELQTRLEAVQGPYCLHFRYATHGAVNIANCHPFRVHKGLYMMHNGVIHIPLADKLYSDSWNFARHYVRPYVQTHGMENLIADAEQFIGGGNKLAFMTRDGQILIANEDLGVWRNGLWYSNSYSFPVVSRWGDSLDWIGKLRQDAMLNDTAFDDTAFDDVLHEPLESIVLDIDSPCDLCETETNRLYYEPDTAMYICAECASMARAEELESWQ